MNTNLLDLNNDILNVFVDYVKKDNLTKELEKEERILNGKKNYIWKPLKCFSWYIPGIYQVYTFIIPKLGIYLVYTRNIFSEKIYILIMLNEYMHLVSTF